MVGIVSLWAVGQSILNSGTCPKGYTQLKINLFSLVGFKVGNTMYCWPKCELETFLVLIFFGYIIIIIEVRMKKNYSKFDIFYTWGLKITKSPPQNSYSLSTFQKYPKIK